MDTANPPVKSLGEFIDRVSSLRRSWGLANHKELWFRGEAKDYGATSLRPELYRPAEGADLKPIPLLLKIENDLHEEFQRIAVERCDRKSDEDEWEWDSYFLMQHHDSPTRLLDWSDGAMMALHFALRNKADDVHDAVVYVLEPYKLLKTLGDLPDRQHLQEDWKAYIGKHPTFGYTDDDWADAYLPADEEELAELSLPGPPLLLEFALITRRIAAQRSRFIVFGTEPDWLSDEFKKPESAIQAITIAREARARMRQELRDCGVTESVIYPDLDGLGREMRQLWEDRRAES